MKQHTKTTCKRALALCMSVLMLMTAWVFVAPTKAAAEPDIDVWQGGWSYNGFSNNHITSADGFAQFINNVGTGTSYSGQTIYLDIDIDLNQINFGNGENGSNVFYDRNNYFEGTFDGQGHTIYEFRMTNDDHRVAMFRSARNATFKNLTVDGIYVDDINNNGRNGFAVIVGYGDGNLTFENVHLKNGIVYGYNYVGGLVGEYGANNTLRITNCTNNITIHADHDRAGGLVGHSKGRVYATGCSNTGEIYAGYSDAGGIAGWIEDDESYFVNCSNTGKVATDACAGGIMGYFGSKSNDNKMTITGCSNTGEIISRGNGYCAGGIAGKLDTDATHSLENNVNHGSVSAKEDVGGIVGSNLGGGVWRNNKNYGNVYCDNDNAAGILGEVEDDKQEFYNCYNTGAIEGKNSTSGILGYGNAAAHTFSHCGNSGYIVSRSSSAGGIYAYGGNSQPVIEDCWNIGTVRAYNDAGGILGHTEHHSYIRRCWNAGSIETYDHNENGAHGGIAGQTSDLSGSSNDNPNMTDCFNWGSVSGGRDDGGLIGKIKDGRTPYYITNSYNAGQVTGTRPYAIIAYGGNVGNNVYYDNGVAMGTVQGTSIGDSDLRNSSGFSGNYCKNTWGVKIGSTTYYYPILNWYRNMFMFHLKFVDDPSGTNVYWDGEYNSAFYAPNPTRRGYTTDHWFLSTDAGKTIAIPTEIVTCGVTPCTDSLLMTQHTDEITTIDNTSVFNLTWEKIKQKLDMNAVLNGEYKFDNIDFFTADVYVNGVKVADDVNDFYDDLYYEDTYEITDIKVAEGYRFIGAYTGVHEGRQQSGLTGQMDIDLIEVAPEFKTLHTVTVTPGTGTTISGVETGTYAYGDTVTITAAAETGYDQSAPVLKVNGSVAASGSTITITGDTTITTENLTLNTYTLNFYNGDNEHPYDTQTYTHGDAFTAPADPTYSDGTDADYEFVGWAAAAYPDEGWDVEVDLPETVTASADYFSLYDGFVTITWKNGDETLAGPTRTMVGTVPAYTGEMPTTADAQYTYTAIGWNTDPNATTALDPMPELGTSNMTYYAVYDKNDEAHRTVNTYTIVWKNWDGTTLETDNNVPYGATPSYDGEAPTREDDAQYHYTTYSWDPMIATVSGPATYTAQFDYVIRSYTVTFKDQNGDVIGTPQEVSYGEDATPPDDLDDYSDANSHYTFDGWSGYTNIQQDTTIQATFTAEAHTFDQQVATADYKASDADCTHAATYYYSCTCGYKGTTTFTSGDPLGHTMTPHDAVAGSDCEHYGTIAYYHCSVCEKDFDDEVGTNELTDLSDHVYGPHAYAFHSFVWAADFTTAQAKYVCGNNANHVALYTATVTPSAHASTCTEAGYTVYTATYDGHTDIKTVTGDPATGHTYAEPAAEDWTWTKNGDAYTATATAICSQCAEGTDGHTTTLTVTAELTEDVPATADAPGYKTYTGTAAVGDQTFAATRTDDYYYVTVTPGTGTTIAGAETGEYEAGTVLTVTAAAQAGYDDSTLTLNVNGTTVENGSTVTVNGQTTITTDDLTALHYTFTYIAKFGDVIGETLFTQTNLSYGTMIMRPIDDPVDVRRGAEVWTFDSYSDGYTAGQSVPVTGDKTIYVLFALTDQPAKYKVTFLNDDNYTKIAEAEYEWEETVVVPETPVSTHRTVSEDYTFLGWTPEVAATVTADATYVATYETEAHARIYHVKWVYGLNNELTAKEENLPYDTVFTAEMIPADVFVKDDSVTHDRYSWETRVGTALADHIGGSTTEAVITGTRHIDRHTGEPDYEWIGSDETGYTKCIATMTCADCGEALSAEYTLDSDDVYTHIGENCQDQGYTSYSAWLNGSGVNSYFENQNKKVYGAYGDHYYPSSSVAIVWNTENVNNVTCKVTQTCHFCGHVDEEYAVVTPDEKTDATCVSPETTVFKAVFANWGVQYSEEIETAPIDPDAHKYDGWDARPDEARCTRPVYDAATETWSKGTLVIPCANTYTLGYDYNPETGEPTVTFNYTVADYAAHDKVLSNLDRADYEAFDEAYAKLQTISGLDIADETVVYSYETYDLQSGEMVTRNITFSEFKENYLGDILARADAFPQNLVTVPAGEDSRFDEQPQVDQMTREMQFALDLFFNEGGAVKEELLNHYTVTFTLKDGSVTTYSDKLKGAVVDVPAAPASVDGYAFLGWTLAGSDDIALATDAATYTVAGDAAFTAKYAASLTTYTVTFVVDGETVSTQTVEHGGSAIAPDVAAYVNNGDNHKKLSAWDVSFTNVTSDLTVSATYETKAHEWQDGEVTLAATCMATGTQAQSCVCGATNVKTLPKDSTNHTGNNTTTRENEVAPTCTAAGSYEEVVTCECGVVISRTNKTEAALGHNFGAWTQTAAPTCDDAGQESRDCSRCDVTETRSVAALGHSWGDWTVTQQATCTAEGSKTRTCTRDASHTETVSIPKTAHHDGDGDNKCDACGAAINTGFRCSFCDTYEANREKPFIGWFYIIVHFFIHLFAQIRAWV